MTANATPFGLRPIGKLDQGSLEPMRQYPIASAYGTNIAAGDVVHLVNNTNVVSIEKQTATGSTSADIDMVGIFMGCTYTDPVLGYVVHSQLWPASTVASDAMAYVVDDPHVLFEIQADGAPASDVRQVYGQNAPFVQTAPNTSLKASRVSLDISNIGTDANLPIRIIDYKGGDAGDEKGTAYPILVCKFNYHQHLAAAGSA